MSEDLIQSGIQAAQSGDQKVAQELLIKAVQQNPRSARAWFWLGQVLNDPAKKQYCLDTAAKIDPAVVDQEQTVLLMDLADTETSRADGFQPAPAAPPVVVVPEQQPRAGGQQRGIFFGLVGLGLLAAFVLATALFGGGAFDSPARMLTPDLAATQTYERLGFQVTAAREALDNDEGESCIEQYDRLLSEMPNWAVGYYNRGVCKRIVTKGETSLALYEEMLRSGIRDQDKALSLNPNYGKAYVERSFDYQNLTETLDNYAEDQQVLNIAYENIVRANALKADHISAKVNIPIVLIELDRCQEGLEEANRLIDNTAPGLSMATLNYTMATGHLCLGNYGKALPLIEKANDIERTSSSVAKQTSILIGAGRTDEAFRVIDEYIGCCPDFGGYRYYLRALLYLDRGEFELARQDVETGYFYTWYHRGLYAYLMGKLALHDGDRREGIKWITYAAESMRPTEGLWVKERIFADLDALGINYRSPKPKVRWNVTPIPPLDD